MCELLKGPKPGAKKQAFKESVLYLFCMKHSLETECFGKGTCNKPPCRFLSAKECRRRSAQSVDRRNPFHQCHGDEEEENDEEEFVNTATGEYECEGDKGWRTPEDS